MRLPAGSSSPLQGGFVSGSAGAFASDLGGVINLGNQSTPITVAVPVLHGSFSDPRASYDSAIRRWLPVSRNVVRNDGLAYAYAEAYKVSATDQLESRTHIHVVSLPSGADRVVYSGGPYAVIAFEPEGIYIVGVHYYAGEGSDGLWRLNPADGSVTAVFGHAYFVQVGSGYGWTENAGITPSSLNRIDLKSGATQRWVNTASNQFISFLGTDSAGHPFVTVGQFGDQTDELFVYTSPGARTDLGRFPVWLLVSLSDQNGTWFGGADGIYLYSTARGLRKVSDVGPGMPAGSCR